MKNKILFAIGIVLVLFVLIYATTLYSGGRAVDEPEIILSYAENQTADYPTTLGGYKFAELVEERSEGRIKVLVKPEAELGSETEVIKQMQFGGIDFARVSLAQLYAYLPALSVLQMPYLYKDSEHMWKVLDGEIGDEFLSGFDSAGLVGLSWYDAGARNFYSTKPITSLEDIEGMRIRVQDSQLMKDVIEALGAVTVTVDYADVYSALQLGDVEGAENNWSSYVAMEHYEVAKYFTEDQHIRLPEVQVISSTTWDKLSEEDREMIIECAKESAIYERKLWVEQAEESKAIALDKGVILIELDEKEKEKFYQATQVVYEEYCEEYMDIINKIATIGE
ncbi:MAG: TRAP transporter substrate-binding protein [Suipraeoptans sp.]